VADALKLDQRLKDAERWEADAQRRFQADLAARKAK
jgi:hypothetical protein